MTVQPAHGTWPFLPFGHYPLAQVKKEQQTCTLLTEQSNPIVLLTPEGHRDKILIHPEDPNIEGLRLPSAEVLAIEATRRLIHHFSERSGLAIYNGAFVLDNFKREPWGAIVLQLRLINQSLPKFITPLEGQPFSLSFSSAPTTRESGSGSTASTIEHNNFVIEISQWLQQFGLDPLSPKSNEPKYDIAWKGRFAFVGEVKTTSESNELDQLYRAIGQVQYYAYRTQSIPILFLEHIPKVSRLTFLRSLGLAVFCRDELGFREPPQ